MTLMTIEKGIFEVKSVAGNPHLGGESFNDRLASDPANQFQSRHGKDLRCNPHSLCRLRAACERAKRALSSSSRTSIELDSLFENIDFSTSVTQKILSDFFDGRELNKSINPDEATCCGVAFQAAVLSGDGLSKRIYEHILLDIAPLSLGIETYEDRLSIGWPSGALSGGVMTNLLHLYSDDDI